MGFRHFSHAVSAIIASLRGGDAATARRTLAEWRGGSAAEIPSQDVARLAIEQGLVDAYRQVFGVLFWFMVLPGPVGAVLYRAAALLADEWRGVVPGDDVSAPVRSLAVFGEPARLLLRWIDWIPVRLTALSFAIVGDFEDAVYCWRTQAHAWPDADTGILLAAGAGAMGVRLGMPIQDVEGEQPRPELGVGEPADGPFLDSTVGMLWRAVVVWIFVLALVSVARLL
jgi:cobalamin biosynthesis protein CobD/CbiB